MEQNQNGNPSNGDTGAEAKQASVEASAEDLQKQIETIEKRRKDTQAAYTKARQEVAELRAQLKALQEQVKPQPDISPTEQKELDELKFADPDAWYRKMKQLEESAKQKLSESVSQLSQKEKAAMTMELALEEWNRTNPDAPITHDNLQYDIPPRIMKQLEDGKLTFEEFLTKASEYLQKPKKVATDTEPPQQPSLGKVGGSTEPSEDAQDKDVAQNYDNLVF
jgi:chaperonin cofactor prefoldin